MVSFFAVLRYIKREKALLANNMQKKLRSCGVHDGTFHADEITACALLMLFDLIDEDKIIRTRDLDVLSTCEYVCDVGGGNMTLKKNYLIITKSIIKVL